MAQTSPERGLSPLSARRTRIMIVDDHPIVRDGLAELIAQQPDMEVCGEAADVGEAVRKIKEACPDVVLVDLSLRSGHGIDLIEQVKCHNGQVKMLVASVHGEQMFAERALRAGAVGYINKQEPTSRIIEAIRQVMRGELYLSPNMASRLLHAIGGGAPLEEDPIGGLSNRELEVFEMIGEGLTTKRIAEKLLLSPKTIESHRDKIKTKLNLSNANELTRRAVQWVIEKR